MGQCASKEKHSRKTKTGENAKANMAEDVVDVTPTGSPEVMVVESPTNASPYSYENLMKNADDMPYGYENIIKDADSPVDRSSIQKLFDQLNSGVFLNNKRKKYWIEKESGLNSFMQFPRDLIVVWGEDEKYWHWSSVSEPDGTLVEVAELLQVCWLEIRGTFPTSLLSPETMYETVFIVMLDEEASGWEVPVSIEYNLQGVQNKRKVSLIAKPRAEWIELKVGEFCTSAYNEMGDISFRLNGEDGLNWKSGLHFKGLVIRPKTEV